MTIQLEIKTKCSRPINGDGNCHFSTFTFILTTGSKFYHQQIREMIASKMLTILKVRCNRFLSSFEYKESNYRNFQDFTRL